MGAQGRGNMWFAVSLVMVALVSVVVLGPTRSPGLRSVDIVILFCGGFAAGAAFVRGVMLRRPGP